MDKWGGCYFENFTDKFAKDNKWNKINKYIEPRDATSQRSFCCRYNVRMEDIIKSSWGTSFRSNSWVGWVWVFNININRIAFTSIENWKFNKDKFYERLEFIMEACQNFAQKRRKFIEDNKELYPYFFFYNKSLDTFFNVLSVVGGDEAIRNLGHDWGLKSPEWRKLAHEMAEFMVNKINMMMERDKSPISLEYAPSENGWPTLAKKDKEIVNIWHSNVFNEKIHIDNVILQWDWNDVFLTSWFQPPYNESNIGSQIQISAEFQSYATWWSVQHFFLGERISIDAKKNLIKKVFQNPVMYITLTPTLSNCLDCWNQLVWEYLACPNCESKNMQVASRVIGYLRPIAGNNLRKENKRLDGENNFWQDARRNDWASRRQTKTEDIKKV